VRALTVGWFARGRILMSFYAAFRPLFRRVGDGSPGIPSETTLRITLSDHEGEL
jgi:hypothetical protein